MNLIKYLTVAAPMAVTMTACFSPMTDEEDNEMSDQTKQFTFHVKGDFGVSYDEMTRAAVRLEDDNTAGITDLWVLDYQNEGTDDAPQWTLVQQVHQTPQDEGFGHPQMELAYGHHDVKLIASKGESPALSVGAGEAHSLAWSKVKDTFTLDYPVDVAASSNGNRAPELKRAVSGIKLVMTDAVPTNAKEIQITAKRSLSLALPSLVASELNETTVTSAFPTSWAGLKDRSVYTYTLCPEEEFVTDIAIKIIATDNSVVSNFTVPNVSMKKNRLTTLTGECFSRGSGFSVMIVDAWDEGLEVNF